jgi:hypothetical protein
MTALLVMPALAATRVLTETLNEIAHNPGSPKFRHRQAARLLPAIRQDTGHVPCESDGQQEGVMSQVIVPRRGILSFLVAAVEHVFFVIAGFVFMVVGVGLSVTMIMLPVGLALGLLGFAMFVGGLTVRMSRP